MGTDGRRRLRVEIDIYGLDDDADPTHIAQTLGFPIGEVIGFEGVDGYDDDDLSFNPINAEWV